MRLSIAGEESARLGIAEERRRITMREPQHARYKKLQAIPWDGL
jgi:hypothetical protein